jgi:hypothetical protein
MRVFFRHHGLSITMLGLFAAFLAGQVASGRMQYNEERQERGESEVLLSIWLREVNSQEAKESRDAALRERGVSGERLRHRRFLQSHRTKDRLHHWFEFLAPSHAGGARSA